MLDVSRVNAINNKILFISILALGFTPESHFHKYNTFVSTCPIQVSKNRGFDKKWKRPRLKNLSLFSVPRPGIEPGWIAPLVFETSASTDSAIWAFASANLRIVFLLRKYCGFFLLFLCVFFLLLFDYRAFFIKFAFVMRLVHSCIAVNESHWN